MSKFCWGSSANNYCQDMYSSSARNPTDREIICKSYRRIYGKKRNFKRRRYMGLTKNVSFHRYVRRSPPVSYALNSSSGITAVNGAAVVTPAFGLSLYFQLANIVSTVGTNALIATSLAYSDLATLYDMYRIDKITLDFYWSNNMSSNNNSYALPLMQTAIDYDDVLAPTNSNTLTQFSTFRLDAFGNKATSHYRHSIIPRISEATNNALVGGAVGTTLKSAVFLDSESPSVSHTGFKTWFDFGNNLNNADGVVTMYVTYHLSCKLVK